MKQLLTIIILTSLLSCADKKKEDKLIDNEKVEAVEEINLSNKDSQIEIQENDTLKIVETKIDSTVKTTTDSIPKNSNNKKQHKEIPPDGTYIYDIAYAEWQGRSLGEKVKVVIKGNAIKIIAIGRSSVGVNDGEIIDEGTLIKHNVTGDWLITNDPSDADLDAYGGCVGIAMVIDFVNKKYWTC